METKFFEIPAKALGAQEAASVTALHAQKDGSLLCGLRFASPCLFRVAVQKSESKFIDLKLEEVLGADLLGVTGGLRSTTSGDTAFGALHGGMLPGFLQGLFGGSPRKKSGRELLDFLVKNDGGLGTCVRHSVVQLAKDEINLRRVKEPGAIFDVAHVGDFIFGLAGNSIWREPYMNSEKRETLRKDLGYNESFHRDSQGNFWLVGENQRLQRMGQTDIKSKPTVLKLAESTLSLSTSSETDGWLYVTTLNSKDLYRLRRNPVSFEEELQKVHSFATEITGLVAIDREGEGSTSELIVTLKGSAAVEVYSVGLLVPEDPELPPPAPAPQRLGEIANAKQLNALTVDETDKDRKSVWAAADGLRLVKISL